MEIQDAVVATHREELEEGILEHLPLLVLIRNHWNVNFAQILGEQEDQADRAVGEKKNQRTRQNVSLTPVYPEGLVLTRCLFGILWCDDVRRRRQQVRACPFTRPGCATSAQAEPRGSRAV